MELRDALSAFTGARILVLGDSMVDEYVTGDCSRLSPEAPVPILRVDPLKTRRVLGGAANTAANIASLGGTPVLFALYDSTDAAGTAFTSLCAAQNITVRPFADGRPTMVKMRVVDQRQQLLRMDREDTREIAPDTEAAILAAFRAALPDASAVVLSDYAKGFFSAALTRGLIEEARASGKPVVVDPRPRHVARYQDADYVTPNWKESLGMLGWDERDATPDAVKAVGCALRDRLNANILLTLGPAGIALFGRDGKECLLRPVATPREVFDVSGAGDTVVAAFTLALATGQQPDLAVEIANRAAGVVVGKLGTATVTREEISAGALEGSRLVTRDRLAHLAALLRAQGRRIVTLNGSFDLLHAGHLHILGEARRQGDVLIVGVNSDASVKRYKAADRPFIGEDDRARMLLALRVVDYVHVFGEDDPLAFLEEVRPHVHVNGSEYGADCIEAPVVKKHGGRVHIVEKIPGLSTSALGDKIKGST